MAISQLLKDSFLGCPVALHNVPFATFPPPTTMSVLAAARAQQLSWPEKFLPQAGDRSTGFLSNRLSVSPQVLSPRWHMLPAPSIRALSTRAAPRKRNAAGGGTGGADAVVVVESPSKAKTVGRYLGPGYVVLASYGHVRDLAPQPGSVQPDNDWAMTWAVPGKAHKSLAAIREALRGKQLLVLASDPDREGEAIAWHLQETLNEAGALDNMKVIRVAFNEITREAVLAALAAPRAVSTPLVEAYLARRGLDYVMGYGLSPVLWRKLPGSKSAGRVQSVALRLVTDREHAIRTFVRREYWSVAARLAGHAGDTFEAALTHLDGRKLGQFGLTTEEEAQSAAARVREVALAVVEVKRSKVERSPPPPFTTSTLQQEASAKLNLGAAQTMALAQKLYEGADVGAGLITYMRTDATTLSSSAVSAIRATIGARYGTEYLPAQPRVYKTKAKNAQEAHEAIRPTDMALLPAALAGRVDPAALRLYSLIWRRTAACQMASAVYAQLAVDAGSAAGEVRLHAVASQVEFPGHLAVHSDADAGARFAREQVPEADEAGSGEDPLPGVGSGLEQLAVGQALSVGNVKPDQHFTQPPPRFTEGTLVKALEEAGVGRPSTYAATLRTLVERAYVRKEARRLVPEMRGLLVAAFLQHYFPRFVDTGFTAQLEAQLDDITAGDRPYKAVLAAFHQDLQAAIDSTAAISKQQVEDALEAAFGDWLFPPAAAPGADPRACPTCGQGHLELKLSKMGGFLGCSHYPDCKARFPLSFGSPLDKASAGGVPVPLGTDPATDMAVTMRMGPYGAYLQLGEQQGKAKPKRVALPKGIGNDVDLAYALQLLALPQHVGEHPDLGGPITLNVGKFGPYVEHAGKAASLPTGRDMFAFTLAEAVPLLAAKGKTLRGRGRPKKAVAAESAAAVKVPGKRGRKKKVAGPDEGVAAEASREPKKARAKKAPPAKVEAKRLGETAPKRRGRPRKVAAPQPAAEGSGEGGKAASGVRIRRAANDEETSSRAAAGDKSAEASPGRRIRAASGRQVGAAQDGAQTDAPAAARKGPKAPARAGSRRAVIEASERAALSAGEDDSGESRGEGTAAGEAGAPQPRILTEWPRKRRSSAEKAADHAAGVFRPWEVQLGLHLPWVQQQTAARAAATNDTGERGGGVESGSREEAAGEEGASTRADKGSEEQVARRKMRVRPSLKVRPSPLGGQRSGGKPQGDPEEEEQRYAVAAGQ